MHFHSRLPGQVPGAGWSPHSLSKPTESVHVPSGSVVLFNPTWSPWGQHNIFLLSVKSRSVQISWGTCSKLHSHSERPQISWPLESGLSTAWRHHRFFLSQLCHLWNLLSSPGLEFYNIKVLFDHELIALPINLSYFHFWFLSPQAVWLGFEHFWDILKILASNFTDSCVSNSKLFPSTYWW